MNHISGSTQGALNPPTTSLNHCRLGCKNVKRSIKTLLSNTISFYYSYSVLVYFLHVRDSIYKKVQVGKDQENAQSEKDSHSKNQGGKKPN